MACESAAGAKSGLRLALAASAFCRRGCRLRHARYAERHAIGQTAEVSTNASRKLLGRPTSSESGESFDSINERRSVSVSRCFDVGDQGNREGINGG